MTTSNLEYHGNKQDLFNTKLIIPGINSIGYLGMLVCDLMIYNLKFHRIGYFTCPFIEPISGTNIYNATMSGSSSTKSGNNDTMSGWTNGELYTTFEVYQLNDITIFMLRSNVIQGFGLEFTNELCNWIKQFEFKSVTILTGLDKKKRNDDQIQENEDFQFRYYSKSIELKIKRIETQIQIFPYKSTFPPGGGLTNFMINELEDQNLLVLACFTDVGDNTNLSFQFAKLVLNIFNIECDLIKPNSWNLLLGPETSSINELF